MIIGKQSEFGSRNLWLCKKPIDLMELDQTCGPMHIALFPAWLKPQNSIPHN
jgi:hypothetical protein